jgi:chromosomal replication initiation ATPase DnaA
MQKLRSARVALYRSRRGISNEPGNVAIYLLRTLRGDNLEEIGRDFNISRFSSVSSVVERMRGKISNPPASPGISPNGM